MKLSQWLDIPNPDGSRKRRDKFAESIEVTPQMISAYCAEDGKRKIYPSMETQRLIFRETDGAVTPNDWASIETISVAADGDEAAA